jgi:hypothetical protein
MRLVEKMFEPLAHGKTLRDVAGMNLVATIKRAAGGGPDETQNALARFREAHPEYRHKLDLELFERAVAAWRDAAPGKNTAKWVPTRDALSSADLVPRQMRGATLEQRWKRWCSRGSLGSYLDE